MSARNLAATLTYQAKYAEAEEMLQATAYRRVLGSDHPDTLGAAQRLENVRSEMRAVQPTRLGGKATARRTERAAAPALSPTALAEAEAKAGAAEAELPVLAMLDLEEPEAGAAGGSGAAKGSAKSSAKGKAKGQAKGQGDKR